MYPEDVNPGDPIEADFTNEVKEYATRDIGGQEGTFCFFNGVQIGGGGQPPAIAPRHFELKDDHDPGTTTTAHPQDWNGTDWVTDTDADREFDVTDPLSEYRGRGKDTFSSPHDTGSEGVAEKNSESGEWEIVRMKKHALWLVGDVYADFATTDSTFEVDGVEVAFPIGGIITDTDPAANITVYNIHGWDGDANDKAEVRWNEAQTRWECTELDC